MNYKVFTIINKPLGFDETNVPLLEIINSIPFNNSTVSFFPFPRLFDPNCAIRINVGVSLATNLLAKVNKKEVMIQIAIKKNL